MLGRLFAFWQQHYNIQESNRDNIDGRSSYMCVHLPEETRPTRPAPYTGNLLLQLVYRQASATSTPNFTLVTNGLVFEAH